MFSGLDSPDHPVRSDLIAGLHGEWKRLGSPGAVWTGAQRIGLAAQARAARNGENLATDILPRVAVDAARMVGAQPADVRSSNVQQWVEGGMGAAKYVELVGVVARSTAVDSIVRGLGGEPESYPAPIDGDPTGEVAEDARQHRAWVPMVGGASIVSALSLVPSEMNAMFEFHGPAYLTMEQMADPVFTRGLDRAQMELVAARTSATNECFY